MPSACPTRSWWCWTSSSPPPASSPRWRMALLEQDVAGKAVIYSTTNGTVALSKSREAAHVFAASLLNAEAVVDRIERTFPDETVLLVCSGSADNFNLE